ncbi:MAG: tRNA pseudouridine(55) synthase TruB [Dethiobacter sp.]|nr:tRNA pseudouridine(55) synthase TruB [Dethiobacter sp.]MBS3943282.1 tRNA pseudouridine(55) synthase TruB [Dethiobacter sp.]
MDGFINLNKPSGLTSHGCVDQVRKQFPGVKVGHAGTLDPAATGVLPICLGRATRLVEFLMESNKGYRAGVQLGVATDTEDAQGKVLEKHPVPDLDQAMLKSVLQDLTGEQEQTPPAYSAVKYHGRPLYYWARKGISIPGKARTIKIYSLHMLQFNPCGQPHLLLDVVCSKGTYIRTLAAEIGRRIGCGACLWNLERYFVGAFSLDHALTLQDLQTAAGQGNLKSLLIPMDKTLQHLPALTLDQAAERLLKQGRALDYQQLTTEAAPEPTGTPIRIYGSEGRFLGLAQWVSDGETIFLKTVKYLAADEGEQVRWS